MMDYIGTKWKGQQIPKSQESDLMILSGGQTIVILFPGQCTIIVR